MLIVDNEIAYHRRGDETGKREEVGDVVDILMAGGVEFERRFEFCC